MNNLLRYLMESGGCLLVFYLVYTWVLQRESAFTYNRFFLLLTPVLAFLLPLVELPVSLWPEPKPLSLPLFQPEQLDPVTFNVPTFDVPAAVPAAPKVLPKASSHDFTLGLLLLYGAGVSFFIFRLLRQLYRLQLFTRQTQASCFYWQNIPVHKTNGAQPTFSFSNRIFWDNSQPVSAAEREHIFRHEAVHIRQRHSWDILYLELLKSIFWFNPLFYFYQKALINTHEFIADAAVLRSTDPETYARLLVKQLFHRLEFSFANYFSKSLTIKRLKMLQQTRRPSKIKQLIALPVLIMLVFVLSSGNSSLPEAVKNQAYLTHAFPVDKAGSFTLQPKFSELLFPGGKEAMYDFITKNIKYSAEGINASTNWQMTITVKINEKGILEIPQFIPDNRENHSIYFNTTNPFEKEIHRVLNAMPRNWTPATVKGEPVASRYLFNFMFDEVNSETELPINEEKEEYEFDLAHNPVVSSKTIKVIIYDKNIPLESKSNKPKTAFHNPKAIVQPAAATYGSVQTIASLAYDNKVQFPLFPGGHQNMYRYLRDNVRFDKYIYHLGNNTAGTFTAVEIEVDEKGQVTPVTSVDDDAFAREINEAIRRMPAWQPAEVDGQPTASTYNLVLLFKKEVDEDMVGWIKENLEKYTGSELKINAVLFGKKAYVAENNPDEPVLTVVEKKPEFPGGMEKMYDFINKNLQYPLAARAAKLERMVLAKFIVTKDGRILESRIEGHLSPETDAELLRVIGQMPRWVPGKQNGKPVNVEYTLPFKFRLNHKLPKS